LIGHIELASLMVIGYFNVKRIGIPETETNSPLTINPNTPLPFSLSLKRLQPIPRWYPKIRQAYSRIQYTQLPQCDSLNVIRNLLDAISIKQSFGRFASKRLNHPAE